MNIAMIGAGYVGLVSGACFSEFGFRVVCVDIDAGKVAALNRGEVPIFEPGLSALIDSNRSAGRLGFTTDLAGTVAASDVVFIAVGTPSRRGDGHADLSHVMEAATQIAHALDGYTVVVDKSTVPVGTGRRVAEAIAAVRPEAEFDVVSNPEFLREGAAIGDFMRPDRVVIGTESERAREVMRRLYRVLFLNKTPIVETTLETAELSKYATNAFLATKITFINEMADICEEVGADVQSVAGIMGLDGRIGPKFLHAGPGYGGSCFPKDTLALARTARDVAAPTRLVEAVAGINADRKAAMFDRIASAAGDLTGRVVAVLGLAFKPNTDDMREAPSLEIVPRLVAAGASLRAFDPEAMGEAAKLLADVHWATSALEAAAGADILVVLTEWNEFRALDATRLAAAMRGRMILDLRNVLDATTLRQAGFAVYALGRGRPARHLAEVAEV